MNPALRESFRTARPCIKLNIQGRYRSVMNPFMKPGADAATGTVVLRAVANECSGGECPTVYVTDRDTVVVQGYLLRPEAAGVSVPDGEVLVEIPPDLLATAVRTLSQ